MFRRQQGSIIEMHCKEVRRLIVDYLNGELDLET
jgi:hypothetical protein